MKNDGNIAIPANLLDTLKNLQDSIFNHFDLFQQVLNSMGWLFFDF